MAHTAAASFCLSPMYLLFELACEAAHEWQVTHLHNINIFSFSSLISGSRNHNPESPPSPQDPYSFFPSRDLKRNFHLFRKHTGGQLLKQNYRKISISRPHIQASNKSTGKDQNKPRPLQNHPPLPLPTIRRYKPPKNFRFPIRIRSFFSLKRRVISILTSIQEIKNYSVTAGEDTHGTGARYGF